MSLCDAFSVLLLIIFVGVALGTHLSLLPSLCTLTGYLITISDSMVNALDHILLAGNATNDDSLFASVLLSRRFWVVGALFAVLPFSFYRTLDELKRASALALIFVFMLVGMIISYANGVADPCAGYDDGTCRGEMAAFTDVPSTLSKLPIFVFAFTCHQNIFPIVNEIEFLSQRRVDIVIVTSIGFAMVIFSVVAIEGYRTYGFLVRGDILLNYPENAQVTFLRICIAFMLALHYPLQLDPSRRCISSLVKVVMEWWKTKGNTTKKSGGIEMKKDQLPPYEEESVDDFSYRELSSKQRIASGVDNDKHMFYGITVAFLFSSFVLAMIVDDLGVILALVGATGSTLVSYIIPGLVFIKIHEGEHSSSTTMAYTQLVAGMAIIPFALYFIITEQMTH